MLERVDRMLLAVRDASAGAQVFEDILGAVRVGDDAVEAYAARRITVQAGDSEFEILEPAGEGPVSQHLERWGDGIFAAGFSSRDVGDVAESLGASRVVFKQDGDRLLIEPDQTRGMRTVISPFAERKTTGLISWLYEVTNIVTDHEEAANFYTAAFGLDKSRFSPIKSERYGYIGTLTLYDPPARLDRIELTQITEPSLAMGRFFARRGPSVYMCYAETPDVSAIQARLENRGARYAGRSDDPNPEGLFIHPTALCGMLMGISRTNLAWTWSGRPDLAKAPA
jgi:catechol 2,3-dioxygenase-like lactoylglutathione lyase family enzyme